MVLLTHKISPGADSLNASSNLQNEQIRIFAFNALTSKSDSWSTNFSQSQFSISTLNCKNRRENDERTNKPWSKAYQ